MSQSRFQRRIAYILVALAFQLFASPSLYSQTSDLELPDGSVVRAAIKQSRELVVRLNSIGGNAKVDGVLFRNQSSTGILINSTGDVITAAYNLAHRPTAIFATYSNGRRVPMKILARNQARNVVMMRPDTDSVELPDTLVKREWKFPARDELLIGQTAIAVGTSSELDAKTSGPQLNVSVGIVSATNRIWGRAIQTDANVSSVNYGGPLLNVRGQIVGILIPAKPSADNVSAGVDWYDSGIGFAVPLSELRIEQLANGENQIAGIFGATLDQSRGFASKARVTQLKPSDPAYGAGLRVGDVIVQVNDRRATLANQVKHVLGGLYAGDAVRLKFRRDGEIKTLEFQLGREE